MTHDEYASLVYHWGEERVDDTIKFIQDNKDHQGIYLQLEPTPLLIHQILSVVHPIATTKPPCTWMKDFGSKLRMPRDS